MPSELRPQWAAPPTVRALMSTRQGGAGVAPFDSNNLALDPADPAAAENRRRFAAALGARPQWLQQVHGATVVRLGQHALSVGTGAPRADASVTRVPGQACTVLVADCLPVLLCAGNGSAVGAAHAGWRGLAAGVLDNTVAALCELCSDAPASLLAWLGPCIGPRRFEVGPDVLQAFGLDPCTTDSALFRRHDRADGDPRWLADLAGLARQRLQTLGVTQISGGQWCTVEQASDYFSFRRDGQSGPRSGSGRMAAGIAIVG